MNSLEKPSNTMRFYEIVYNNLKSLKSFQILFNFKKTNETEWNIKKYFEILTNPLISWKSSEIQWIFMKYLGIYRERLWLFLKSRKTQ